MTNPHDNITVGKVTLVYSMKHRSWLTPAKLIIRNPIAAQRVAEKLNESLKFSQIKAVHHGR
ncbi:TPA: DUF1317 family protein [Klebsiella pneumoniae]|nr:DUF1317 domain-containing protein [Klebsiella pneumoniae]HBR0812902.1 DUF1317 family protein [Klebsiella pneumoniae]